MGQAARQCLALARAASPGSLVIAGGRRLYRWTNGDTTPITVVAGLLRAGKLSMIDGRVYARDDNILRDDDERVIKTSVCNGLRREVNVLD